MEIYSPADVAALLGLNTATLRKYSIAMEREGYTFERNDKNHRFYRDKDVATLRQIRTAKKNGRTIDQAVYDVVHLNQSNNETNVIQNDDETLSSETTELIRQQNELIKALYAKLDQQREYIDSRLERIEKAFAVPYQEQQKQVEDETAATQETQEREPEPKPKKGFFTRLFGK